MKTFKSTKEKTKELIEKNNVAVIKNHVYMNSEEGELILMLIKENSNDFTADIATRTLEKINLELNNYLTGRIKMSEKQAWCCAYQVINNLEVYKTAVIEFS